MIRNLAAPICGLLVALAAFANMQAHAAMPPHGPYAKDCHPDNVHAVVHGGVTIAFDCFSSNTETSAMYGARLRFGPEEERYSTGGATSSTMDISISADPGCPALRDGSTLALAGSCILITGSVTGGLAYLNTCGYKSNSPVMRALMRTAVMQWCSIAGMKAVNTAGSITFTHWSGKPGGRLAFTFSPGARLTEFVSDLKAPNGVSVHVMHIPD